MFASEEVLSALRSPPDAIANRLSAPAKPSTLTLDVLSVAIEPSPGNCAPGDTTFVTGVVTAMPNARDADVCAHPGDGSAALHSAAMSNTPSAHPVILASLFMILSSFGKKLHDRMVVSKIRSGTAGCRPRVCRGACSGVSSPASPKCTRPPTSRALTTHP